MQHVFLLISQRLAHPIVLTTEDSISDVIGRYPNYILIEVCGDQRCVAGLSFMLDGELEIERRFE